MDGEHLTAVFFLKVIEKIWRNIEKQHFETKQHSHQLSTLFFMNPRVPHNSIKFLKQRTIGNLLLEEYFRGLTWSIR